MSKHFVESNVCLLLGSLAWLFWVCWWFYCFGAAVELHLVCLVLELHSSQEVVPIVQHSFYLGNLFIMPVLLFYYSFVREFQWEMSNYSEYFSGWEALMVVGLDIFLLLALFYAGDMFFIILLGIWDYSSSYTGSIQFSLVVSSPILDGLANQDLSWSVFNWLLYCINLAAYIVYFHLLGLIFSLKTFLVVGFFKVNCGWKFIFMFTVFCKSSGWGNYISLPEFVSIVHTRTLCYYAVENILYLLCAGWQGVYLVKYTGLFWGSTVIHCNFYPVSLKWLSIMASGGVFGEGSTFFIIVTFWWIMDVHFQTNFSEVSLYLLLGSYTGHLGNLLFKTIKGMICTVFKLLSFNYTNLFINFVWSMFVFAGSWIVFLVLDATIFSVGLSLLTIICTWFFGMGFQVAVEYY